MRPLGKLSAGAAALAALALGGSAIANAASPSTSTSQGASGSNPPAHPAFNGPAPGTAAHEDAEKPVSGTTADTVRAAAVKAEGGGTAGAVTTNYTDTGYETTVTKSDGTKVEVHLDKSFNVMPGPGSPGGPPGGGAAGPPPGHPGA